MISTATMLEWLGITSPTALQEAQVEYLVNAATATLGRELSRYLGEPAETVEILMGNGTGELWLADEPSDPEITVETRAAYAASWTEADPTSYVLEGRALRRQYAWPHMNNTQVTYERGYELDEGPAELVELVRQMVQQAWASQGTNTAMKSETFDDYSYTRADLESQAGWSVVANRWRKGRV